MKLRTRGRVSLRLNEYLRPRQRIRDSGANVGTWTHHDLRRTAATRMAEIGIQPHIVEAVLNHVSGHKHGVASIYNRATVEREKATALAIWSEHLLTLVEDPEQKVINLRA
jgi:hypothetical protein